jgi:hypothetical protein
MTCVGVLVAMCFLFITRSKVHTLANSLGSGRSEIDCVVCRVSCVVCRVSCVVCVVRVVSCVSC